MIDILIDDGGHTNLQQIVTVHSAVKHIRDEGIIVIEDVHTSYFREFGNPWKHSFIRFTSKIVDSINSRASALSSCRELYANLVYQVSNFESIVVFHINTRLCKKSSPRSNGGLAQNASDVRYQSYLQIWLFSFKNNIFKSLKDNNILSKLAIRDIYILPMVLSRIEFIQHAHYWKKCVK